MLRSINDLKVYFGAAAIQLVGYVGYLAYFFHVLACLYLLLVRSELCQDFNCAVGATTSHAILVSGEVVENDWLPPYQMRAPELRLNFETYCFCFWWAMSVVIGAAVPIPTTFVETLYTIFAVFVGFLLYAWLIGSFTTALAHMSAASRQENEQRDYINQYLCGL